MKLRARKTDEWRRSSSPSPAGDPSLAAYRGRSTGREYGEREIFEACLQLDRGGRSVFLERVCDGDVRLAGRVLRLLEAHDEAESATSASARRPAELETPERIGPYRILELIGEGGMGAVYLAEQVAPIRRRVALKIIKLGMDTKEVIARFESERQVLALMNHPSIAQILDAGATERGRPFFVMEYVKGIPIVEYCDRRRFGLTERLELFGRVLSAVQHAHQKGRDPPRPQAVEHPDHRSRWADGSEGDRLRGGKGHGSAPQ